MLWFIKRKSLEVTLPPGVEKFIVWIVSVQKKEVALRKCWNVFFCSGSINWKSVSRYFSFGYIEGGVCVFVFTRGAFDSVSLSLSLGIQELNTCPICQGIPLLLLAPDVQVKRVEVEEPGIICACHCGCSLENGSVCMWRTRLTLHKTLPHTSSNFWIVVRTVPGGSDERGLFRAITRYYPRGGMMLRSLIEWNEMPSDVFLGLENFVGRKNKNWIPIVSLWLIT